MYAIVAGFVDKAAERRTAKNGNPYAICTIREPVRHAEPRWWNCIAFGQKAIDDLEKLNVGDPVAASGEASAETYKPHKPTGPEARINWRLTLEGVLSAGPAEPKGETRP